MNYFTPDNMILKPLQPWHHCKRKLNFPVFLSSQLQNSFLSLTWFSVKMSLPRATWLLVCLCNNTSQSPCSTNLRLLFHGSALDPSHFFWEKTGLNRIFFCINSKEEKLRKLRKTEKTVTCTLDIKTLRDILTISTNQHCICRLKKNKKRALLYV